MSDPARRFDWTQPSFAKRAYELRDPQGDEGLVAALQFEPKPTISWNLTDPQAAVASAAGEQWRFTVERPGVPGALGYAARVSVTGSHAARLEARSFLAVGELTYADGSALQWRGKLVRGTTSAFVREDERPLVSFRSGAPLQRVTTRVEISTEGMERRDWRLLVGLGFYMRILLGRVWR